MSHLRLVTDDPPSPKEKKPRRRMPALSYEERLHLSAALRSLQRRYGSWKRVADALNMGISTLGSAVRARHGSTTMAFRAAQLLGTTTERILSGTLATTGKCPHCGQSMPELK
jgi:hypothetical protein